MAQRGSTARKRERERMKIEKAAMKRERRDQRKSERLAADTERAVEDQAEGAACAHQEEQAVVEAIGAEPPRVDSARPSCNLTSGADSPKGVGRNGDDAVQ